MLDPRSIALALLVTVAACKREPPPPQGRVAPAKEPLPTSAPSARWEGKRLVVEGHPGWKLEITYGHDGGVHLPLTGGPSWPKGTKAILGKTEQWIEGSGVDMGKQLGIFGSVPL